MTDQAVTLIWQAAMIAPNVAWVIWVILARARRKERDQATVEAEYWRQRLAVQVTTGEALARERDAARLNYSAALVEANCLASDLSALRAQIARRDQPRAAGGRFGSKVRQWDGESV